jgi:hypothetical protein
MKQITILALSAALVCVAGQVNAAPIYGAIDFTGYGSTIDTTSAGTATEVVTWGAATTGGGTVSLAGENSLAAVFSHPWTFNSGAVSSFITFDGYTFNLVSSSVASQINGGAFGYVNVSGIGWLSGNGNGPSAFDFSFTASSSGPSTPGDQAFSANITAIPDGGMTVALLGGALTALGLLRRKLVA